MFLSCLKNVKEVDFSLVLVVFKFLTLENISVRNHDKLD